MPPKQYRLLSESATQVMVRIEVEGASSEQEYELSLECFRVPDESAWEVGFGLPCITTAAARKGVLSATVELEAEGFYVVVPSFGKCVDDEDVEFKIAFAANQEVEIERLPFLQARASALDFPPVLWASTPSPCSLIRDPSSLRGIPDAPSLPLPGYYCNVHRVGTCHPASARPREAGRASGR